MLGIDPSAALIDHATRAHAAVPTSASRSATHAASASIDVSTPPSFDALHRVPAFDTALVGLHGALVPGGRAWLRLVTRGSEASLE